MAVKATACDLEANTASNLICRQFTGKEAKCPHAGCNDFAALALSQWDSSLATPGPGTAFCTDCFNSLCCLDPYLEKVEEFEACKLKELEKLSFKSILESLASGKILPLPWEACKEPPKQNRTAQLAQGCSKMKGKFVSDISTSTDCRDECDLKTERPLFIKE